MADASRDENFVPTLLGVSNVDGTTPVKIYADPVTHRLLVSLSGTGGGDVVGPASATDNAIARYDGVTGKLIQNSNVTISDTGAITIAGTITLPIVDGSNGQFLTTNGAGTLSWATVAGTGTVTSVSVVTANGVSGSVANATTTPAITLTLGAITPSAVQVSGLTASEIVITDASKNLVSAAVATYPSLTELTYLKGVTSAIQTQLNAKGTGNVTGPGSSTDNAIARFDSTTGKIIQNSAVIVDDNGRLRLGGADGSAMVDIIGATTTVQGLRIQGDVASALSFSTYVAADSFLRFSFLASGQMTWGDGAGAGDTNLYRSAASTLRTDDLMVASLGFQPAANDGAALGASGTAFSDLFLASGAVINFNAGNYTITHSAGLLTTNGALSIGTSNAFTAGTIELGAATDTTISRSAAGVIAVEGVVIPSISSTNTLTNKRITKRVGSTTSSATPTINTDDVDAYHLTAQTADITSFTTNLSGTPTDFQQLRISVTGTAARAITWGSSFANGPVALPTTTVTTTRLDVLFEYDTVTSKWRCMASGSTV